MNLTNPEKLIIAMLAEIHQKLDIDDGLDSKFVQDALYSDNAWAIPWNLSGVFGDNQDEIPPDVSEVFDILSMWSIVERELKKFDEKENNEIRDEYRFTEFFGFDGNNEAGHLCIANFMIRNMDTFPEFHGRKLNSHMPTLSIYKPMVEVHKGLNDYGNNDPAGIIKILAVHSK